MSYFTGVLVLDLLGVLTAVVAIGYAYFKWSYQYWKRHNVPYFEPTIPFGTFQGIVKKTVSVGKELKDVYRKAKVNGWRHCGVYIFSSPVYMPIDLDLIRNIMTRDFNYFSDRGAYTNDRDEPIASHLAHVGGQRWRNLRTKLTPSYTSGKLKGMFQTLVDCGVNFEKYFEESPANRIAVDIKDVLGRFTTDVIGSCAFGLDCNSFKEPNSPFRTYGKKAFKNTKLEIIKIQFATSYPKVARALGILRHTKDTTAFFTKTIEDTIAYREKNNVTRKDVLQSLIDLKNNKEISEGEYQGDGMTLTLPEIVSQSFMFFVAGFESSSTTMTFALYQLATHQSMQDKVRAEIKTVLAKHDNQMNYDSMNDLKYLGQVIDETLRIFPAVAVCKRICVKDYKVPDEDVVIEKGTRVNIPVLPLHYDPEYYKDPEVFDPDRFSEENKKLRHPYAYLPFGEGPRICIGQRFGIMETKVGLVSILKNYKATLNKKTAAPLNLNFGGSIVHVEGGIWLDFEKV